MLKLNIEHIAKSRAIEKVFTFLRSNGFTHSTAHRLASGNAGSISLDDLETLCISFRCTPHDLLHFIPDSEEENKPNHPLASLKKQPIDFNINTAIRDLPLDKLEEIQKIITEARSKK